MAAVRIQVSDCYMCGGTGERRGATCDRCGGRGVIRESVIVDRSSDSSR